MSQQIQMGIIQIVGGGTPPDHRWAKQILEKWLSNRDTMVSKNNMSLNVPGAEERTLSPPEGNAASTDAAKDARHSASPELVVAQSVLTSRNRLSLAPVSELLCAKVYKFLVCKGKGLPLGSPLISARFRLLHGEGHHDALCNRPRDCIDRNLCRSGCGGRCTSCLLRRCG